MQGEHEEKRQTGTVQLVYPEIKKGRVIADVTAAGLGDYFVGERTRAYVSTGQREAILVPESYVYRRADLTYVKLADGIEVVVQTGAAHEEQVEILTGLAEGDTVVQP